MAFPTFLWEWVGQCADPNHSWGINQPGLLLGSTTPLRFSLSGAGSLAQRRRGDFDLVKNRPEKARSFRLRLQAMVAYQSGHCRYRNRYRNRYRYRFQLWLAPRPLSTTQTWLPSFGLNATTRLHCPDSHVRIRSGDLSIPRPKATPSLLSP